VREALSGHECCWICISYHAAESKQVPQWNWLPVSSQLPFLETLLLEGHGVHSITDEINLLECQQCTYLVINRTILLIHNDHSVLADESCGQADSPTCKIFRRMLGKSSGLVP